MKANETLAGTLKVEIIKPESDTWDNVGARLRVLRWTCAAALNRTMSALYVPAQEAIAAMRGGDKDAFSAAMNGMRGKASPLLQENWNAEIDRAQATEPERVKRKQQRGSFQPEAYSHVTEYWTAETIDNIMSRFAGEHLKDLLALRASTPSFNHGCAFMARSRACDISGPASEARLDLPLFGAGKKSTRLVVVPDGQSVKDMWNRLVVAKREIDSLAGRLDDRREACKRNGVDWKSDPEAMEIKAALDTIGPKMGRVGIKFDENRRKWFAMISWSREPKAESVGNLEAAAHIGTRVFVQVLASNGDETSVSAAQIQVTRERFDERRRSIGRAIKTMGGGSKGHGVKRRMLPLTRLEDAESRWTTTFIRQTAAHVIGWCLEHNVGLLRWPDMTGMREDFERSTGGEAHEEVKRLIHEFPFFELSNAVVRQGDEKGVRVELHSTAYDSTTCPNCGHASAGNLVERVGRAETKIIDGERWERREVFRLFKCESCGFDRYRDIVACANALNRSGANGALVKMTAKARKRARKTVESTLGQEDVRNA